MLCNAMPQKVVLDGKGAKSGPSLCSWVLQVKGEGFASSCRHTCFKVFELIAVLSTEARAKPRMLDRIRRQNDVRGACRLESLNFGNLV